MAVAATGFFDGVHLGHRAVLDKLRSIALYKGEQSVVVTFWPHPKTVLEPGDRCVRLLSSIEEKVEIIRSIGIDRVEVLPFDREFSLLSAKDFVSEYLSRRMGIDTLVIGYDHRIGHDSFSSREEMLSVIESCGITPLSVEEFAPDSGKVNSTVIRKFIAEGDMTAASSLLGYDYSLDGVIGKGEGRCFLTLSEPMKIVPCDGSYEVSVHLPSGLHRVASCRIECGRVLFDSSPVPDGEGNSVVKLKFAKGMEKSN